MSGSKKTETVDRKFKATLIGTRNSLEYFILYGKGLAIDEVCGAKVDARFQLASHEVCI